MGKCNPASTGKLISAIATGVLWGAAAVAGCAEGSVQVRGDFGEARFRVEVADDADERAVGLMNRDFLASSAGMLFVYDHPQPAAFWMRNTLIPLDMLFIDESGRITHIHENAQPLDETPIPGGDAVFAVLEINGGLSRRIGIAEGDVLRHPSFPSDRQAWPCDSVGN